MNADVEVLSIENLSVDVQDGRDRRRILENVALAAYSGRITGVVGETGSGKTMTMLTVFGLLPKGARVSGAVRFHDVSLEPGHVSREGLLGRRMAMVFQDARSSLHPTFSIGRQLGWAIERAAGRRLRKREREAQALALLDRVGLPATSEELRSYPFEFSGGMCQRVAIGIAIACSPELLVADEPTSALDATIQLQIADLIGELTRTSRMACVLVTHDFRLVQYLCDDVAVFKDGRVVESGELSQVLTAPKHDYSRLLVETAEMRVV